MSPPRSTLLAVFVVTALAFVLAVATGASVADVSAQPEIDVAGGLEIAPHDGPNGQYASIEDGQLRIDVPLQSRGVTVIDDVFTITAVHENISKVRLGHDEDDVTLYADGDPYDPIDDEEGAAISPGETVSVGIMAHATDEIEITELSFETERLTSTPAATRSTPTSVHEAKFEVRNVSADPTTIRTGETATITMEVENVGDAAGEYTAELTVDGIVVETRTVSIEPGETRTITFERSFLHAGEHTFSISGSDGTPHSGFVSVSEPEGGPTLTVTNATTAATSVSVGDETVISALVTNGGTESRTITVELAVGGVVVDTQTISVPAGSTVEVSFTHTFQETGTYAVSIAGVDAGSVSIGESTLESIVNRSLQTSTATALGPFVLGGALLFAWLRGRISRY